MQEGLRSLHRSNKVGFMFVLTAGHLCVCHPKKFSLPLPYYLETVPVDHAN